METSAILKSASRGVRFDARHCAAAHVSRQLDASDGNSTYSINSRLVMKSKNKQIYEENCHCSVYKKL